MYFLLSKYFGLVFAGVTVQDLCVRHVAITKELEKRENQELAALLSATSITVSVVVQQEVFIAPPATFLEQPQVYICYICYNHYFYYYYNYLFFFYLLYIVYILGSY